MSFKIGLPRGLLYYRYGPMWEFFFSALGLEVVVSPPTDKEILRRGLSAAVDDICLPVKAYLGHVLSLAPRVDFLFIPRLVSLSPDTYQCPKFLGLPDVVKALLPDLPPVIDTAYNSKLPGESLKKSLMEAGRVFVFKDALLEKAAEAALGVQENFVACLKEGMSFEEARRSAECGVRSAEFKSLEFFNSEFRIPHSAIGLVGHPYNIYDQYLSVGVKQKLESMGASVLTPDRVTEEEIIAGCRDLPKNIYWQLNRETVGAAVSFMQQKEIQGVVHLNSFACGPDSFAKDLIDRRAKRYRNIPYLSLILDEHTAEAGLVTRLEAFMDMVKHSRPGAAGKIVSPPVLQPR